MIDRNFEKIAKFACKRPITKYQAWNILGNDNLIISNKEGIIRNPQIEPFKLKMKEKGGYNKFAMID